MNIRCFRRYRMNMWVLGALILFAGAGLYLASLQVTGNFHEVVPGELYRSAQLTPKMITRYAREHHIASIINLRGENRGQPWYDDEIRASQANHVQHYDFRMSAKHLLSTRQTQELITLMKTAPKPMLIHCYSGADRTGLASALYLASIGHDEFTAELQISPLYGHIPLRFIGAPQMDATFENMEPMLGYKKG